MKITGQILKENRERKGVSLNEVSVATKITIKTLAAIESADPANLPPKTFLRGFVRSYAIYLGCDVDEILRTFHEEMGSTLSRPILSGPNPSELNAAATEAVSEVDVGHVSSSSAGSSGNALQDRVAPVERRAPKKIDAEATLRAETSLVTKGGIVGGILLLIILIVFLKGKMDSYESERATGPTDPASVETASPLTPEAAATAQSQAEDSGADTDDQRAGDGADGSPIAANPVDTAAVAAAAPPAPLPKPTATPTPTPKPTATPRPSATPATAAAAPPGKSHEILIEALDQVDIEITVDGEAPRTIKLRGDQVQSIKVKKKAILKLSDGGAINLIVNGIDRGVPGDLGKPTRVELP